MNRVVSKLLGAILIFLMAAIGSEVYFLTQLNKKSPPLLTTISPAKSNRPTISQSQQKNHKSPIFDPSDWKPWRPDKVGSYHNVKYGVIYRVQAKAENVVNRRQIKAKAGDGEMLTFILSTDSAYFSRREKPRQPSTLSKVDHFNLEKGKTYLFEWLESQNKSNLDNINVWHITKLED